MFSETNEYISGNPNSPYVWRIKAAYFFAAPLIMCLSVIRAVFRVDATVAIGTPGVFVRERRTANTLTIIGAMVVRYYDDVQAVPALEEEYAGRDAGYLTPPMHDAFIRAAMAVSNIPAVRALLVEDNIPSSLINKNDNDSRGNA